MSRLLLTPSHSTRPQGEQKESTILYTGLQHNTLLGKRRCVCVCDSFILATCTYQGSMPRYNILLPSLEQGLSLFSVPPPPPPFPSFPNFFPLRRPPSALDYVYTDCHGPILQTDRASPPPPPCPSHKSAGEGEEGGSGGERKMCVSFLSTVPRQKK